MIGLQGMWWLPATAPLSRFNVAVDVAEADEYDVFRRVGGGDRRRLARVPALQKTVLFQDSEDTAGLVGQNHENSPNSPGS
jgi:hypothetical protein